MKKQLKTIKNQDSKIAGLALGFADYFDIDVTIIRIILVGLFFTPVPIVIIYAILWLVLPKTHQTQQLSYEYQTI